MKTETDPLLLDTHVWLWLVRGEGSLSEAVLERIFEAAGMLSLFLSVVSIWEVSILDAKGRITLNLPCLQWVRTALQRSGAEPVPLTPEIAVECHHLPAWSYNDPADRILVATARQEGMTLLTRDRTILDYAGKGHVRALAC
jgi:PIN domain nuclease of toxin-antitoxin system